MAGGEEGGRDVEGAELGGSSSGWWLLLAWWLMER